jgi:predicted helicase
MSAIRKLFDTYREQSKTKREQGTYFEKLVINFLLNDERYLPQFTRVESFKRWADKNEHSGFDSGIDLVATNSEEYGGGFSAIQCKFYNTTTISKSEIDSFMATSDKTYFNRRILVDTSPNGLNHVVESQLENSTKEFTRISLDDFETSSIDWDTYTKTEIVKHADKKELRPHQTDALNETLKGFTTANRGKLLMACGTGKTFTALKIAETYAGKNKLVLFLVPSLALMSQTITEWAVETGTPLHSFAVCSDVAVGKRKKDDDDIADINIHDLAYPATTDAKKLADKIAIVHQDKMTVVFSTYQSIDVIHNAQAKYGMREFDLIICDEAHRTTGATLLGEDDSNFVKIHNNDFIKGLKRLYMTATPRVYIGQVKEKAKEKNADLYSMDDIDTYGQVFYSLKFGEAVEKGLLSDYKVLVLAVDEGQVAKDIQKRLAEAGRQKEFNKKILELDDATKIIGCYKALIKHGNDTGGTHMSRAVAFCNSIKSSELFTNEFKLVVDEYLSNYPEVSDVVCELQHVDGTMGAAERTNKLSWLKENTEDVCRILSNARCLSEGVDVPSLDAVMFIHGRKSKVDIVQSVGRVMRVAPGKKLGYVIIPVAIPAGVNADEALNTNVNYQIVWDVLNALRSHDERLDANINKVELLDNLSDKIEAIRDRIEIVATVKDLPQHKKKEDNTTGIGSGGNSRDRGDNDSDINLAIDSKQTLRQDELELTNYSIQKAILAKIVDKCGTRTYWEDWANDISNIANKHITRIKVTLEDKSSKAYLKFKEFVDDLKDNINDAVSEEEVIEMLAQHIITKPVFNALFCGYNFTEHNSISKSMQSVLDALDEHNIDNEAQKLEKFYESVKRRADGIDSPEAKQKIIVELYNKFFRNAFPRMTERLGIVYTPVECVDFIIHSVNDILKQEFGQELGDKNTHIIDPFTGTGTFITRLMQSGLLSKEQLEYKYNLREKHLNGEKLYTTELHANEIVLLAYYIASINIESVYHAVVGGNYNPFEGICLTDTFQLNERSDDLITPQLADNNHRRKIQKKLPIRVFIGNPPYSAGQSSGNDNNQNLKYPNLDASISSTYEKYGTSTNNNSLYDSYIRAIRWASSRIDKYGVIGFITNAGWIESNSADGMRKCLQEEFSSIYVFHLRGNARTSGELRRKEKDNIFGIGTRTPIAIAILVKNPNAQEQGKIYFHDIGDYLTKEEKLEKVANLKSIETITQQGLWQSITPDKHNDWLNQRDDGFYDYISIGDKKDKNEVTIFENYSRGLASARDAWVYNYSKSKLTQNVSNMIDFYNSELERYKNSDAIKSQPRKPADAEKYIASFVNNDSTKISWNRSIQQEFSKLRSSLLEKTDIIKSLYRPFTKSPCYFNKVWNDMIYQLPKIFPENSIENLVISVPGIGSKVTFSTLASKTLPDLGVLSACQCFPMYLYEPKPEAINGFDFSDDSDVVTAPSGNQYTRRDAITDAGLKHFTDFYNNKSITKEDLFYYIYGLLHLEEYKTKYADNLTKALPRIPCVKTIADFRAFEQAGRKLADLHLNYENKELYPVIFAKDISQLQVDDFRVIKMKFASKSDKSKIIYNGKITLENIPLEAYKYVVNGKSAIEWVMERQGVSTHKDSGVVNDANDWAIETMHNAKYPLELLLRVITVSLETMKIVNNLPKQCFDA